MPGSPRRSREPSGPLAEIAALLAARRLALGLTQVELAQLAGVSTPTVIAAESGSIRLGVRSLIRVADALGLVIAVGPRPDLRDRPEVALAGLL